MTWTAISRASLWRLLILLGALASLAGAAAAQTLTPVKVGIPGNSSAFSPWFVAKSAGLFERNGLEVQFVFLVGNAVPPALESNGIQATPLVGEITFGNLAGYKVRPIALLMSKAPYMIVAKRSIQSVEDLKGKIIATSPPKGTPNALLAYFLAKNTLEAKDVSLLFIGSESARRTMVLTGQADAIIEDSQGGFELEDKLDTLHTLVPSSAMPPELIVGVCASDDLIKNNPAMLKQMLRALAEANDFIRANPAKAAELLLLDLKTSAAISRQVVDGFLPSLTTRLVPSEALYASEAELDAPSRGKDITPAILKSVWDVSLAREVDGERSAK